MLDSFPDRRERLFGRERDVHLLVDRAHLVGLTAVSGRPLMGKTWTLTEVSRRLLEEGRFIVGYHEATGGESSHLLYAVANLYAHWLADSSMREQAISLWQRHKDGMLPRIGQLIGQLFDKLGGHVMPEDTRGIVRNMFDGLAESHKDLQTGGLQLAALPYDQALALTKLVAEISSCRVVLVLDAWEKSPSLRTEYGTLECIVKCPEDWRHAHLFLGVRNPEVDSTRLNDEGYRRARDLCSISSTAKLYELPILDQSDRQERTRLVQFVRERLPGTRDRSDSEIIDAIDGYPGVIDFWTKESLPITRTWAEIVGTARDAQSLRYAELSHLLAGLPRSARELAARIAFLPRLDAEHWDLFRKLIMETRSSSELDALFDSKVLLDDSVPTFGHDTRHAAARQWFIDSERPLMRRVANQLVEGFASEITGIDSPSRPYVEALVASAAIARQVSVNPSSLCLLAAAESAFGDTSALMEVEFDQHYLPTVRANPRFTPVIASALNNRAADKHRSGDTAGCIDDVRVMLGLPGLPTPHRARGLFNLGVATASAGRLPEAIDHYDELIELDRKARLEQGGRDGTAFPDLTPEALIFRSVARGRLGDIEGEISDLTAVITMAGTWNPILARAFLYRSITLLQRGSRAEALEDANKAAELEDLPDALRCQVLGHRAHARKLLGDLDGALQDCIDAEPFASADPDRLNEILIQRGILRGELRDSTGEIAEYTRVIDLGAGTTRLRARAHIYRAITLADTGNLAAALDDYSKAIGMEGVAVDDLVQALTNRGSLFVGMDRFQDAIADWKAILVIPNRTETNAADALLAIGQLHRRLDQEALAIEAFSQAIDLPGCSAELRARALKLRGGAHARLGHHESAIADYTSVLDMSELPIDDLISTFLHRAIAYSLGGKSEQAIADYGAAIDLPHVEPEILSQALLGRGIEFKELGHIPAAIVDIERALAIEEIPASIADIAKRALAEIATRVERHS